MGKYHRGLPHLHHSVHDLLLIRVTRLDLQQAFLREHFVAFKCFLRQLVRVVCSIDEGGGLGDRFDRSGVVGHGEVDVRVRMRRSIVNGNYFWWGYLIVIRILKNIFEPEFR